MPPESDRAAVRAHDALVGGPERRTIVIADYEPGWPQRFERERARIASALGPVALAIEHIGSTAVPGLAAKPIVDVAVGVADPDDEAAFGPALEAAGFAIRVRERGHRMFRTPARDVHVHVWAAGSDDFARHLAFRDRLRTSPADRDAYAQCKRELAAREWDDMNAYADAKGPLIQAIMEGARS